MKKKEVEKLLHTRIAELERKIQRMEMLDRFNSSPLLKERIAFTEKMLEVSETVLNNLLMIGGKDGN